MAITDYLPDHHGNDRGCEVCGAPRVWMQDGIHPRCEEHADVTPAMLTLAKKLARQIAGDPAGKE